MLWKRLRRLFPDEEPTHVRFKGKKRTFVLLLKKGDTKILANVSFRVLDTRKMVHVTEYDLETVQEKVMTSSLWEL